MCDNNIVLTEEERMKRYPMYLSQMQTELCAKILVDKAHLHEQVAEKLARGIVGLYQRNSMDELNRISGPIAFITALTMYSEQHCEYKVNYEALNALDCDDFCYVIVVLCNILEQRCPEDFEGTQCYLHEDARDIVYSKIFLPAEKVWKGEKDRWELFLRGVSKGVLKLVAGESEGETEDTGFSFRTHIGNGSEDVFIHSAESVEDAQNKAEEWLLRKYKERRSSICRNLGEMSYAISVLGNNKSDDKASGNGNELAGGYYLIPTYDLLTDDEESAKKDCDEWPTAVFAIDRDFLEFYAHDVCGYATFESFISEFTFDEISDLPVKAEREGKLAFSVRDGSSVITLPYNFDKGNHFAPYIDYIGEMAGHPFSTVRRENPRT